MTILKDRTRLTDLLYYFIFIKLKIKNFSIKNGLHSKSEDRFLICLLKGINRLNWQKLLHPLYDGVFPED